MSMMTPSNRGHRRSSRTRKCPPELNESSSGTSSDDTVVVGTTLKRKVGLFSATAVVIGSIIGSGIFVSPSLVFRNSGSTGASLLMWLGAGFITLIYAFCMAELGALLPTSGGEYAYICAACYTLGRPGDYVVFMYSWTRILLGDSLGAALHALTFTSYALRLVYPTCEAPYAVTVLVAASFSTLATVLNAISIGVSTKLQNILAVTKILMLVCIIGTGIVSAANGTNHLREPFFSADVTAGGLTEAYFAAFMTMDGGYSICNLGEEIRNPSQVIPRALILGSVMVMLLFIATNVAYFVVLEPTAITSSETTALTFAAKSWGPAGAAIILLLASLSMFGTLSAGFFSQSRLGFAAARRGHLPSALRLVSMKSSVPVISLVVRGAFTAAFTVIGSLESVVNSVMLLCVVFNLLTTFTLLRLRRTMRDVPRPVKVPYFFIFVNFAVNFASVVVNVWKAADLYMLVIMILVLFAGSVAYLVFLVCGYAMPGTLRLSMFLQKLFLSVPCRDSCIY
ncbi:b(0,+)-type amino acid transporter 1-like isoform X1 [Dermacentor silvarum]|uniref:b(0,+)-type amino acid transporter 1-like isoform X1 n=1 Tax=Dermacentor silvarum TaxID=543639 RepID=UPI002100FF90|nr:b(0,+)-type amino acid transporter 1-like isoform X1 [Dermacentor silvarum]